MTFKCHLCGDVVSEDFFKQDRGRGKLVLVTAETAESSDLGVVLLIEDDPQMQKVLSRIFSEQHYKTVIAGDGRSGIEAFTKVNPVAVVLDLMLPQVTGRDVCKRLKEISGETPVIILSAITEVIDKVLLLELGADDYVTKPFNPRELIARVQAAIRRRQRPIVGAVYRFGTCEIDFKRMRATCADQPVVLTALEFKLLRFFIDHTDRVLSREELLTEVWGYNFFPTTRTVDNQILKLRQKLESDPANPRHLQTIYGAGYKFLP